VADIRFDGKVAIVTGAGGGLIEEGEDIGLIETGFSEAMAMVDDGRIADAKTVILLYRAALERRA